MKARERAIDDLHLLALAEYEDSPAMVRRIQRRYRDHVEYLVRVTRRASRRRRRR